MKAVRTKTILAKGQTATLTFSVIINGKIFRVGKAKVRWNKDRIEIEKMEYHWLMSQQR